jgi:hypothetical protein
MNAKTKAGPQTAGYFPAAAGEDEYHREHRGRALLDEGSMNDAEIQNLLDPWIRARRRVWDAFFGLVNANAPSPWKEIGERSTGFYEQMVESVLEAQAAALGTALRAFGPANSMRQFVVAWGEGMRRFSETAAETQRKSGERAEKGPTITAKEVHVPSKAA